MRAVIKMKGSNKEMRTARSITSHMRQSIIEDRKEQKEQEYDSDYLSNLHLDNKTRDYHESSGYLELPYGDFIEQIENPEEYMVREEIRQDNIQLLYAAIGRLTPKQQRIIWLFLEGKNQSEIAEEMNTSQSDISLAWHGVKVYNGDYAGKTYGGIIHRLQQELGLVKITKRIASRRIPKETKEQMYKWASEGMSGELIAERLNISYQYVRELCIDKKISMKKAQESKRRESIINLRKQGKSIGKITKLLGYDKATISKYIPKELKNIKREAFNKLTPELIDKIKQGLNSDLTIRQLANKLGITERTIYTYKRKWKDEEE